MEAGPERDETIKRRQTWIEGYLFGWYTGDRGDQRGKAFDSPLSAEDVIKVEEFLQRLRQLQASGRPLTIPLVGTKEDLFHTYIGEETDNRIKPLRKVLHNLPPVEGVPLFKQAEDNLIVWEVGKRLGVFPRRSRDNLLYESHYPEYTTRGMEAGSMSVIYNCLPIKGIGRAYWHEIVLQEQFGNYINSAAVTVNKNFPITTGKGLRGIIDQARIRR